MQRIFIGLPIRITCRNRVQTKVTMNIPFMQQNVELLLNLFTF